MLILIYILLVFVFLVITFFKYKTVIHHNVIYTLVWSITGILSILSNLEILQPRIEIHIMIFVSIIIVNIIYIIIVKRNIIVINPTRIHNNYKFIKYSFYFMLIWLLPLTLEALRQIIEFGFSNYRGLIFDKAFGSSNYGILRNISYFFTNILPYSIIDAISIIAIVDYFRGGKKLIIYAVIGVIIYTITYGGRYSIFNFIIYFLFTFFIFKKKDRKKIYIKKYILLSFILLILVTFSRGLGDFSIIDMIILYFVGSLSFLELIFSNPIAFGLGVGMKLNGFLTFGFIFEPIVMVLKGITSINVEVPSYYFNIYMQNFYNIGEYGSITMYNNNTTIFYYFIRDFGSLGIFIGPLIIISIVTLFNSKYAKTKNIFYLYCSIFMVGMIVASTMTYTLSTIKATITFLFFYFATKKVNGGLE